MITKQEVSQFVLNEATQFHLLRHFFAIDKPYRDQLIDFGFTNDELNTQLAMAGGKFLVNFASNPLVLFEHVKKRIVALDAPFHSYEDRGHCNVLFDASSYQGGIGLDGIVKISDLSDEERVFIHSEMRDGFIIKVYSQVSKRATLQANIAFQRKDNRLLIKTIFPGTFAPPFPGKGYQEEQALEDSRTFWSQFALVR